MQQQIFLTKAKRNIEAAQLLFDHQLYDDSANRSYYAAFHAAIAALEAAGIKAGQLRHKAVQAKFNSEFIHRRKIFPGRFKAYIPSFFSARVAADYKSTFVSKNKALDRLNKAKEFVERITVEINK